MKRALVLAGSTALVALMALSAHATEIVYTPINPSFGGNPLNSAHLLGVAQAQNDKKDPSIDSNTRTDQQSLLQRFNDRLQQAVLDRISSAVTGSVVGQNGELRPGIVETSQFSVEIKDIGNGLLRITTTDKTTGASTFFEVNSRL